MYFILVIRSLLYFTLKWLIIFITTCLSRLVFCYLLLNVFRVQSSFCKYISSFFFLSLILGDAVLTDWRRTVNLICDIWTRSVVLFHKKETGSSLANEVESNENEIFAHRAKRIVFLANGEKKILYEEANVCTKLFFYYIFSVTKGFLIGFCIWW